MQAKIAEQEAQDAEVAKFKSENAGVDTVLVLTGETTNADVSASVEKPNYVENSVATLYKKWRKDRQYLHHNEESEVG